MLEKLKKVAQTETIDISIISKKKPKILSVAMEVLEPIQNVKFSVTSNH